VPRGSEDPNGPGRPEDLNGSGGPEDPNWPGRPKILTGQAGPKT